MFYFERDSKNLAADIVEFSERFLTVNLIPYKVISDDLEIKLINNDDIEKNKLLINSMKLQDPIVLTKINN